MLDRRPSGTRQRLANALGKNRSFVSQISNPAYPVPIPAPHIEIIFDICHFSPAERQAFLDAFQRAHPNRSSRAAARRACGRSSSKSPISATPRSTGNSTNSCARRRGGLSRLMRSRKLDVAQTDREERHEEVSQLAADDACRRASTASPPRTPTSSRSATASNIVRRKTLTPGKVALISGGGAGHEPLHAGLVGPGMLDAACPGQIFTAPTPDQMLAAAQAVDQGAGVLFIVKNYEGDVMNFDMAAEMLEGRARHRAGRRRRRRRDLDLFHRAARRRGDAGGREAGRRRRRAGRGPCRTARRWATPSTDARARWASR